MYWVACPTFPFELYLPLPVIRLLVIAQGLVWVWGRWEQSKWFLPTEMQIEADEAHLRVPSNSFSGAFFCKYTLAFLRDYLCVGPELSFKALHFFVPWNNTIMEAILKEHLSCFFYLYKSYSFVAFRKYFINSFIQDFHLVPWNSSPPNVAVWSSISAGPRIFLGLSHFCGLQESLLKSYS